MTVTGTLTIPKQPAPWTTEQFHNANAVDLLPGYRRCKHVSNGFRCRQTYVGGKSTHAFCFNHRDNPGEYVKPPSLMELVAAEVDKLGRASLRALEREISATPNAIRGAAVRAANAGMIKRGRRPGFYLSKLRT